MVALVGLGNQFVDLAVGDLGEDAVAFPDGQQDGIQHGVHAAHNLRVCALELLRLAAVGELPFLGSVGQAHQFLLQALQNEGDVVDRLLHLLVVALVGLGNQFVDLAIGDLGKNAVALPDGQEDRVQHFVDPLHHFAIDTFKLVSPAALAEMTFLRRLHQAHDFLRDQQQGGILFLPGT